MGLTLQLPLPDKALSPNARVHWAKKAQAVRLARFAASKECRRVLDERGETAPGWTKVSCKVRAFFATDDPRKQPDPDNLLASLKAYRDGIADAGVIVNDRDMWPERPKYRVDAKMPRVEITIEPEE